MIDLGPSSYASTMQIRAQKIAAFEQAWAPVAIRFDVTTERTRRAWASARLVFAA
jgi:hypothetical protein